jgi:hypothetical protein
VDQLDFGRTQQRDHLARHPLAPGVGVAPGEFHQRPVRLAGLRREVQQPFDFDALLRGPPARLDEIHEARGDAVAEAARAEMHPDPDVALLIHEHVDVVVPAADGAELLAGLGLEDVVLVPPGEREERVPRRVGEQGVIGRRVLTLVLEPDPEREGRGDRVGILGEVRLLHRPMLTEEVGEPLAGADRTVAAADVEPDPGHTRLAAVGRHPAHRHDIAHLVVGHQGDVHRAAPHIPRLLEGLGVGCAGAEDRDTVNNLHRTPLHRAPQW